MVEIGLAFSDRSSATFPLVPKTRVWDPHVERGPFQNIWRKEGGEIKQNEMMCMQIFNRLFSICFSSTTNSFQQKPPKEILYSNADRWPSRTQSFEPVRFWKHGVSGSYCTMRPQQHSTMTRLAVCSLHARWPHSRGTVSFTPEGPFELI